MIFTEQEAPNIGIVDLRFLNRISKACDEAVSRSSNSKFFLPLPQSVIPRMLTPIVVRDELMGSLGADLVDTPRRERSGERVQERFDFQALWGMALLFRQHEAEGNYAVIFEFHDDVAIVDDPDVPNEVRFFQVKTKEKGSWKLTDLSSRKKRRTRKAGGDMLDLILKADDAEEGHEEDAAERAPSILGKMFHNVRQFGERVASVTFVSNAPCELHLESRFDFRQCAPATYAKLITAVRAEYDDATEEEVALLGFERTDLSLQDGSAHMKGKLYDFVSRHVGSEVFPLDSLFRLVMDECRTRSKYTGPVSSLGEVVRLKGITRAVMQRWLDDVKAAVRIPSWEELSHDLSYPFFEKSALRSAWSLYRAEVLNQADEALRSIRRAIRDRISQDFGPADDLMTILETVFIEVEGVGRAHLVPFQPAKLKAMILYELHTQDAA